MSDRARSRLSLWVAGLMGFAAGFTWWLVQGENLLNEQPVDNAALVQTLSENAAYESALVRASETESPTTPDDIPLPAIPEAEAEAAMDYFSGEGSALLNFLVQLEGSWDALDQQSCDNYAESLESVGAPSELGVLADRVPDAPARGTLTNLISFSVRHVGSCGGDIAVAAEVAWHWALAARRLAQLGVMLR